MKILKIYCDTNALFHNIKRHEYEPKTHRELVALEKLLELRKSEKCLMYRSRVVRAKLKETPCPEQWRKLQADYEALDQIPQDERPTASYNMPDGMGGGVSGVVTSDYLDEPLYTELQQQGLSEKMLTIFRTLSAITATCF